MRTARAMAQAKVNLLLRVGPPESSGYHGIRTIYQRVDLADELVVRVGGSVRALDVAGPHVPDGGLGPPETNLAYRAAVAYAERTGWPRGFSVELTKHIPVGGGLGGGSADAGAVLRTLNALATRSLDSDELAEIAGSLGADVPFLTLDHPLALGQGRGDLLAVLEPLPVRDVLLAVPHFAIATADAYRWLDEGTAGTMTPLPIPADHVVIGMTGAETWDSIRGLSHNDFEAVVEQRHPELRELRQRLDASGARIARLSGSGSTVFGVFDGPAPQPRDLALDALVIPTRTSSRVVQVEVLE